MIKENELVLVRRPESRIENKKWMAASFERMMESNGRKKHLCSGTWWLECIPYKLNEELLGTEDEPKDIDSLQWGDHCLAWHVVDGWRECVFHSLIKEMNYPWQVILKPKPQEMGKSLNVEIYSSSMLKLFR